jgi:hypothetical protein
MHALTATSLKMMRPCAYSCNSNNVLPVYNFDYVPRPLLSDSAVIAHASREVASPSAFSRTRCKLARSGRSTRSSCSRIQRDTDRKLIIMKHRITIISDWEGKSRPEKLWKSIRKRKHSVIRKGREPGSTFRIVYETRQWNRSDIRNLWRPKA